MTAKAKRPAAPEPEPDRASKVGTIADWFAAGMARSKIPHYAAGEKWTDGPADLDAMAGEAEQRLVADAQGDMAGATLFQARAIRGLYLSMAGAATEADWRTALAARRELNRFIGAQSGPLQALPAAPRRQTIVLNYRPAPGTPHAPQIVAEAKAVPALAEGADPRRTAGRSAGPRPAGDIGPVAGRRAGRKVSRGG